MARIVAMGGGENPKLFEYVKKLTGKDKPHALYIGTAGGDDEAKYNGMKALFESIGCISASLDLIKKEYTEKELDDILDDTDMIYICGGDTYLMLEVWKRTGFDKKLREIYEKDSAVLCGSSAGGMCWFATGYSDCSRKKKPGSNVGFLDCLGYYEEAFCPHAGSRGKEFEEELPELGIDGYRMDDETAFVDNNGKISFIRSEDMLNVCIIRCTENGIVKEYPEVITL